MLETIKKKKRNKWEEERKGGKNEGRKGVSK